MNTQIQTESKPNVVISKCLTFAPCRYDGQVISDPFVTILKDYVNFIPLCPEVELGLGVPRNIIRLVQQPHGTLSLIQPATETDFTDSMVAVCERLLSNLTQIDGFILKSRSPSCGLKDVKVYSQGTASPVVGKSSGLFAQQIEAVFPHLAADDEGRLTNQRLREHYLTKLYLWASFNRLKENPNKQGLVQFQTANKYLLMAYNQQGQKKLGQLVANHSKAKLEEVFISYEAELGLVFANPPRKSSYINVLMHIMGYFSKILSAEEKQFLLTSLDDYLRGEVPLSVPLSLMRSLAVRFQEDYLLSQTIFNPFPHALRLSLDSSKGSI